MALGNVYRIEDCIGLAIQKDWERVLGLVNVEPSKVSGSFHREIRNME